ncbi:hypothetical protein ANN_10821 [Periplaneta americana]|uniref:HMG box domain-containing protein n=1 Tax=Periplaneta americana TaxID=6978 RepID=A0ABQ8T4Z3_PERAM|nr:hypothetical protein ANN_10821 [Periplaneta americana]
MSGENEIVRGPTLVFAQYAVDSAFLSDKEDVHKKPGAGRSQSASDDVHVNTAYALYSSSTYYHSYHVLKTVLEVDSERVTATTTLPLNDNGTSSAVGTHYCLRFCAEPGVNMAATAENAVLSNILCSGCDNVAPACYWRSRNVRSRKHTHRRRTKRPLNAFMNFLSHLRKETQGMSCVELAKKAGAMWRNMNEEEKATYNHSLKSSTSGSQSVQQE